MADGFWNSPMFGASAMMTSAYVSGFPFMRPSKSDPLDQVPTTYLAMLETADGCIKFIERREVDREIRQLMARPIKADALDPLGSLTPTLKRTYDLVDRSGPGGMVLHYRERVD